MRHEDGGELDDTLWQELLRPTHREESCIRKSERGFHLMRLAPKDVPVDGTVVVLAQRRGGLSLVANRGRVVGTEVERHFDPQAVDADRGELAPGTQTGEESRDLVVLVGQKRGEPARIFGVRIRVHREVRGERLASVGHTHAFLALEAEGGEHDHRAPLEAKPDQLPEVVVLLPAQINRLGIGDEGVSVAHPLEVLLHVIEVWLFHRCPRQSVRERPYIGAALHDKCGRPLASGGPGAFVTGRRRSSLSTPPTPARPLSLELIARARSHGDRTALVAPEGIYTYADLLRTSTAGATRLLAGRDDLEDARICYLVPPGWHYTAVQWSVWRAGGLGVPLATSHPTAELAYVLDDAEPEAVVAHPSFVDRIEKPAGERSIPVLQTPVLLGHGPVAGLPDVDEGRSSLMLYTSGTTGRPKGVVLSHANVRAQVESLTEAWRWTEDDHILLHLPLHHVHGIVNILVSALWNGATCEILPRFRAVDVWERLARGEVTLYMAVPTVYRRMIGAWDDALASARRAWSDGARACRLMVSGSAALPLPTLERWEKITGHRLLERYGMTEIGMGLSNPVDGERRPGFVGTPLPAVEVRLVDDDERPIGTGAPGQVLVRGPGVFRSYWRRPDETEAAFTGDGWFRTGDQAVVEEGAYRILGRSSVDILKTGGEKISALEIEDVLRSHPGVTDCAVVGVQDPDWGERVCAAVVCPPPSRLAPEALRLFAKSRLAPYKVPKDVLIVDELPRNAMGKVRKPAVRDLFEPEDAP